jgi:crotonobetainyl-CoA:carnitine CoA-transferase CaiB-like acyl-CoA transferase
MTGVLDGVRVVEVGVWVAGPSAGGLMADWGADVIKIEAPGGDPFRSVFAHLGYEGDYPNPPFALDNRGKRSVVLDLRDDAARAALDRIVATADVFLSNLRTDALERLDLDAPTLSARYPRLVYASVTGYGLDGPDRDRPAYDVGAFVARAGIADLMVPNDTPPLNLRGGFGDHVTGLSALSGILGALYAREHTGAGQVVECSLLQSGMYAVGWDLGMQLTNGKVQKTYPRTANATPLVNSYRTADDRWFFLLGLEADRHFPGLCEAIERPDLLTDERFAHGGERVRNRRVLIAEFDEVFATRTLDEWAAIFDQHDVWFSVVQTLAEVTEDPQAQRSLIELADTGYRTVAPPARFSAAPLTKTGPVPALGEHTAAVLRSVGLSDAEIEALSV